MVATWYKLSSPDLVRFGPDWDTKCRILQRDIHKGVLVKLSNDAFPSAASRRTQSRGPLIQLLWWMSRCRHQGWRSKASGSRVNYRWWQPCNCLSCAAATLPHSIFQALRHCLCCSGLSHRMCTQRRQQVGARLHKVRCQLLLPRLTL